MQAVVLDENQTWSKLHPTIQIWYPEPAADGTARLSWTFVSLQHPRPVQGLEWRRTGRYMPRHSVANALISWAEDNVARLWVQTAFPGEFVFWSLTRLGLDGERKEHFAWPLFDSPQVLELESRDLRLLIHERASSRGATVIQVSPKITSTYSVVDRTVSCSSQHTR